MVVSYDGSAYQGWQIQPHGPTVQAALEAALHTITRQEIKLYGSGRTDTGVHAFNQIASARVPETTDLKRLQAGLNAICAPHISVKAIVPVSESFHARHSATGKTYRYQIFNRFYPSAFGRHRCWWVRTPLDSQAMAEAAQALLGTHDFSAFRAMECSAKSPVRTIERLDVETPAAESPGSESATLTLTIEASGFLQHMARIITGTLVAVGKGRLDAERIRAVLASGDREQADVTAPGRGLHMLRVNYDLETFPELRPLFESGMLGESRPARQQQS